MDAQQALSDLTEISSQIRAAVVFDDKGKVAGSTLGDEARGEELARVAADLLAAAEEVKRGESPLAQLEVATGEGSVFVAREGTTHIAATTSANPTVGLVFYDLKSTLRNVRAKPATRKPEAKKPSAAPKKSAGAAKKKTVARKPAARRKKPDAS